MASSSSKIKVMTVVGTRPELIRLSRTIAELDLAFDHVLVHTGQNFDPELSKVFFDDLDIRQPDFYLNCSGDGATTAETIASILLEVDRLLELEKPDAFLVLGDTNSCLSAIVAKKRQVPIFHMEAGNRCFDERVPEETNRRIVDHIADVNLPYSDIARSYLIREGISEDLIIKTGSPMREVIQYVAPKVEKSDVLGRLGLSPQRFFVVSAHRHENVSPDDKFASLTSTLNALADSYNLPVIVSTHPKLRKRLEGAGVIVNELVEFHAPLGFVDYLSLQKSALAVISDSGTISEEASILKFAALNLREAHERPESMEEANVMMVGLDPTDVLAGLHIVLGQESSSPSLNTPRDYMADNVSKKIVRVIQSYTRYVLRRKLGR